MNDLWKNNLRDIEPYVPGEQSKEKDIVKLNANENPYPPSPKAVEAIKNFGSWLKGLFDKVMEFFSNFINNVEQIFKGIKI